MNTTMASIRLEPDALGHLNLHLSDRVVENVTIKRAFPWSQPDRFISIRDHDGREVFLIEDLAALDAEQQALVRRWLHRHTLIPRIDSIHTIETKQGYLAWDVQTDRGRRAFRVQEREDLRSLSAGRVVVRDTRGNMYELPDMHALDPHSRRELAQLL